MVQSFISSINNEIVLRRRKRLRKRPVHSACLSRCLGRIKARHPNHKRYLSTLKNPKHPGYLRKHKTSRVMPWRIGNRILKRQQIRTSSLESVIIVATPLPTRYQPPTLPHTPCRPRHVSPIVIGRSVGSPMYRVLGLGLLEINDVNWCTSR